MMGALSGQSLTGCGGRELGLFVLLQIFFLLFFVFLTAPHLYIRFDGAGPLDESSGVDVDSLRMRGILLPVPNELSKELLIRNALPPRNIDLFPSLRDDRIVIVLYVHYRPHYLKLVISALSKVQGINETLLIVSHDGFYEDMNSIVESIRFCQVKQIFAPWSPHLYTDEFPGVSLQDCKNNDDAEKLGCTGNPDQYGNHRSVRIVSLKHHWWWMMNTVWNGLTEMKGFNGHIMFMEEDHYVMPNVYRNIQILAKLKEKKCPFCIAVNAAPLDVTSRGEGSRKLYAEKVGNVGYTFNRTVWERIHAKANRFCSFDDYNWDITMWSTVYPTFGNAMYTLRGPRSSAIHFGRCGLHEGYSSTEGSGCRDSDMEFGFVERADMVPNINHRWRVHKYNIEGYSSDFGGWGGWGDKRDQHLCLSFSSMYEKPLLL